MIYHHFLWQFLTMTINLHININNDGYRAFSHKKTREGHLAARIGTALPVVSSITLLDKNEEFDFGVKLIV